MSRIIRSSIQLSKHFQNVRHSSSSSSSFVSSFMSELDSVIPPIDEVSKGGKGNNTRGKGPKGKSSFNKGKGKGKGSPIDVKVRKYVTRLREADRPSDVKNILEELVHSSIPQNIIHYSAAMARLRELKKWNDAIQIFNSFKADPTVLALVEPQDYVEVEGYIDDGLIEYRIQYRRMYNAALTVYSKSGEWRKAFELLDEMDQWESKSTPNPMFVNWMKPDDQNHTSVFTACARAKHDTTDKTDKINNNLVSPYDASLGLLAVLNKRGVPVHPYSYDAIIETCVRHKQWDLVAGLLNTMKSNGIEPTVSTIVHALNQESGLSFADAIDTVTKHLNTSARVTTESDISSTDVAIDGSNNLIAIKELPSRFIKNRLLEICARDGLWKEALEISQIPISSSTSSSTPSSTPSSTSTNVNFDEELLKNSSNSSSFKNKTQNMHTMTRSEIIKQRQEELGQMVGNTILLRTLADTGQWEHILKLISTLFNQQNSSYQIDEKLVATIAHSAMKVHGTHACFPLPSPSSASDTTAEANENNSLSLKTKHKEELFSFFAKFTSQGEYALSSPFQSNLIAAAFNVLLYRLPLPRGSSTLGSNEYNRSNSSSGGSDQREVEDVNDCFQRLESARELLQRFHDMGMVLDDQSYDKIFNFINNSPTLLSPSSSSPSKSSPSSSSSSIDDESNEIMMKVLHELCLVFDHMKLTKTMTSKETFSKVSNVLLSYSNASLNNQQGEENKQEEMDDLVLHLWHELSNRYQISIDYELNKLKRQQELNRSSGSSQLSEEAKVLASKNFTINAKSKSKSSSASPPLLRAALASFAMWSQQIQYKTLQLQSDYEKRTNNDNDDDDVDDMNEEKSVAAGVNAVREAILHVRRQGWAVEAKDINAVAKLLIDQNQGYLAFAILHVLSISSFQTKNDKASSSKKRNNEFIVQDIDLNNEQNDDDDFLDMSELHTTKSSSLRGTKTSSLIEPLLSTYHLAMTAAAQANEIDLALSILLDMKENEVEPTPATTRLVVEITEKQKEMDKIV